MCLYRPKLFIKKKNRDVYRPKLFIKKNKSWWSVWMSVQLVCTYETECARSSKGLLVGAHDWISGRARLNTWYERPMCTKSVHFWIDSVSICRQMFFLQLLTNATLSDSVFSLHDATFRALSSLIVNTPVAHWCSTTASIIATQLYP